MAGVGCGEPLIVVPDLLTRIGPESWVLPWQVIARTSQSRDRQGRWRQKCRHMMDTSASDASYGAAMSHREGGSVMNRVLLPPDVIYAIDDRLSGLLFDGYSYEDHAGKESMNDSKYSDPASAAHQCGCFTATGDRLALADGPTGFRAGGPVWTAAEIRATSRYLAAHLDDARTRW